MRRNPQLCILRIVNHNSKAMIEKQTIPIVASLLINNYQTYLYKALLSAKEEKKII